MVKPILMVLQNMNLNVPCLKYMALNHWIILLTKWFRFLVEWAFHQKLLLTGPTAIQGLTEYLKEPMKSTG